MTRVVAGTDLAKRIELQLPGSVVTSNSSEVSVHSDALHETLQFLRDDDDLDFQFLNSVSAVDYVEYFRAGVPSHVASQEQKLRRQVASLFPRRSHRAVRSRSLERRGASGAGDIRPDGDHVRGAPQHEAHPPMGRVPGHPLRKDFIR